MYPRLVSRARHDRRSDCLEFWRNSRFGDASLYLYERQYGMVVGYVLTEVLLNYSRYGTCNVKQGYKDKLHCVDIIHVHRFHLSLSHSDPG